MDGIYLLNSQTVVGVGQIPVELAFSDVFSDFTTMTKRWISSSCFKHSNSSILTTCKVASFAKMDYPLDQVAVHNGRINGQSLEWKNNYSRIYSEFQYVCLLVKAF
jgi:hypothetical protein